jgi:formiminotetrahydrofolate cyclodeaminase
VAPRVGFVSVALADATVAELLERLAAKTPAPGGGTAAALAGATAAALAEMAAAYALTRAGCDGEGMTALQRRAGALRARLLELADADTRAYQPVLDALALERGDSGRAPALRAALSAAAEVPLEIAAASAEVAELAAASAQAPGNEPLAGDASAAALIAEAATRAAAALVELNLERSPEDPRLGRAAALARRAWETRERVLGRLGGSR